MTSGPLRVRPALVAMTTSSANALLALRGKDKHQGKGQGKRQDKDARARRNGTTRIGDALDEAGLADLAAHETAEVAVHRLPHRVVVG